MNSIVKDQPKDPNASVPKRRHIQDELDTRVVFVPRAAKLLVVAVLIVFLAIAVWSVLGTVPTKVVGSGIILHANEQIYRLQSNEAGRIVAIEVAAGDRVAAGSVVAKLSVPSLEQELLLVQAQWDDLKVHMAATEQRFVAERAERQILADHELQTLAAAAEAAQQQVDAISPNDAGYSAAILQVADVAAQIAAIRSRLFEARTNQATVLAGLRQQISAQEQRVSDLKNRIATASQITAPAAGIVGEIRVQVGQLVSTGDVLLTVVDSSQGYEVLALFPIEVGGRVVEGMPVHIIPDTVQQDRYGAIKGSVQSISEGPVSSTRVELLLGSVDLATLLAGDTASYVAYIELPDDSQTTSGFAWTSGDGPPFAVTPGTPARVDVVVREKPPIALVVPVIRQLLAD